MRANYIFLFTLLLGILMSCGKSGAQQAENGEVQLISIEELPRFLAEHEDVQFVDIRTPAEVSDGTIEGALNIDFRSEDFGTLIQELDKSKKTVIFCARGGRSATACKQMKEMGFTELYDVEGGYNKYKSARQK